MSARDSASPLGLRVPVPVLVLVLVLVHFRGASALVEVNMEDRVEVFRGDTAQISCMFTSDDGVGGVMIQWLYAKRTGDDVRIYYQDSTMRVVDRDTRFTDRIAVNGTGATELLLTIADVQLEDELEFICRVQSLTDGVAEGRTKLKVFVTPDLPSIEAVPTGISVNEGAPSKIGTCEVQNGFPKPNVTWYKNRTPLRGADDGVSVVLRTTMESSGLFSVRSELNMAVVKEDKDARFYCEVTYFVPGGTRMTESRRINITVLYPSTAVRVWVESPKGKIKEGDAVELHCHGDGNMPSSLSIKHGNEEMSLENNVLLLRNVTRVDSGDYRCSSLDMETFEEISGETSLFVHYLDAAVVIPEDSVVLPEKNSLSATCNALSSLPTHTAWLKDGREVSTGHGLTLTDATFDATGTYRCVVTVPELEGMKTSATLRVHVQGPPEVTTPGVTEMEVGSESTVDLSCRVRGFPPPSITWTTSDGKVLDATSQTQGDDAVVSSVQVRVSSDSTVFCNASNEYGAGAVVFSIRAITHTPAPTANTASVSWSTVKAETPLPPKTIKKEGSGVIIAVIIICILLLAILGSVLYFLYKKGKICGRSGKQDLTKEKSSKDNIVVEMKSDNTEEAVLLGVNGDKQPAGRQ